ncbi:MAG: RyR domain-containing protein [Candidatus Cryptobacteroides sp.]
MEKKSEYIPNPIDVSGIVLPPELNDLAELMAKNVHEVWAQTRISQGWTYGEERNDGKKTHPCLIPYEELPESEREYDRNTAFSTLKLIAKLGFKIGKED